MALTPGVQAERDRCAIWCERLAVVFDKSAARLRVEGSFTVQEFSFAWPPFRSRTVVHHNWEKIALEKENAANAIRAAVRMIKEGCPASRYENDPPATTQWE